jgi:hypothetical protein
MVSRNPKGCSIGVFAGNYDKKKSFSFSHRKSIAYATKSAAQHISSRPVSRSRRSSTLFKRSKSVCLKVEMGSCRSSIAIRGTDLLAEFDFANEEGTDLMLFALAGHGKSGALGCALIDSSSGFLCFSKFLRRNNSHMRFVLGVYSDQIWGMGCRCPSSNGEPVYTWLRMLCFN